MLFPNNLSFNSINSCSVSFKNNNKILVKGLLWFVKTHDVGILHNMNKIRDCVRAIEKNICIFFLCIEKGIERALGRFIYSFY